MEPFEWVFIALLVKTTTAAAISMFGTTDYHVNVCKHNDKIVYAKVRDPKENYLLQKGTKCEIVKMNRKEYIKIYRKTHVR